MKWNWNWNHHFQTLVFICIIYSKHCDWPKSCDEERRPVGEFMRPLCFVVHVRSRRKKVHVSYLISRWVPCFFLLNASFVKTKVTCRNAFVDCGCLCRNSSEASYLGRWSGSHFRRLCRQLCVVSGCFVGRFYGVLSTCHARRRQRFQYRNCPRRR